MVALPLLARTSESPVSCHWRATYRVPHRRVVTTAPCSPGNRCCVAEYGLSSRDDMSFLCIWVAAAWDACSGLLPSRRAVMYAAYQSHQSCLGATFSNG